MGITLRAYDPARHYDRIGRFLVETYAPDRQPGNWLQPRWEYMHYLCVPYFGVSPEDLARIGIWERDGRIVAVVHFEERLGQAYFELHPEHPELKGEMLDYAEDRLAAIRADGTRVLRAYLCDADGEFQSIAHARGYQANGAADEVLSRLDVHRVTPPRALAAGFALLSLADEDDVAKVVRVLHRGFDHPGVPPERNVAIQRVTQSAPGFRRDLTMVVRAPSGDYVSYCGLWLDPASRIAMVEPVATDPDYRRTGLATAVVGEALRRAGALGAAVGYVGADLPVYLAMGFRPVGRYLAWEREWASVQRDHRAVDRRRV